MAELNKACEDKTSKLLNDKTQKLKYLMMYSSIKAKQSQENLLMFVMEA